MGAEPRCATFVAQPVSLLAFRAMTNTPLTREQRSLRAKIASETSWSRTVDRTKRTEAARDAAYRRFEREVDPDNTLPPADRAVRAEAARRAHFLRMALASSRARARRKETADGKPS